MNDMQILIMFMCMILGYYIIYFPTMKGNKETAKEIKADVEKTIKKFGWCKQYNARCLCCKAWAVMWKKYLGVKK